MSVVKISLDNLLTDTQKRIIIKKLSNPDEISTVPITVSASEITIGYDPDAEGKEIWEEIYRKLGYRAPGI